MISVKHLIKVYRRKGGAVRALDDVSLDLPAHGLVFLVGKSGAGKSALLNILGGVDLPDGGELIANGKNYKNCAPTELDDYRGAQVALVAFDDDIIDGLTAAQNVELALRMRGKKNAKETARELLASVGYDESPSLRSYALSERQKRQVSLARALANERAAILADDPTAGVSGEEGVQLAETLQKIAADRLVVAATSDRALAEKFGDRIVELDEGRIVADSGACPPVRTAAVQTDASRPRVPLSFAARLGAGALMSKPLRLIATLLAAVVAFGTFGVFGAMATYDVNAAAVSALTGTEQNAALLCKKYVVREHTTHYEYYNGRLVQSVKKGKTALTTGIPASEVGKYDNARLGVRCAGVFGPNGAAGLGVTVLNFNSVAAVDDAAAADVLYCDAYGFTDAGEAYVTDVFGADACLAGAYPTADDEIAISERTYEAIAAYGLFAYDAASGEYGDLITVSSPAEAVGQCLVVGMGNTDLPLTIAGVFRTGVTDPADASAFDRLFYVTEGFYDAHVDTTATRTTVVFGANYATCDLSYDKRGYSGRSSFPFIFPETLAACGDNAIVYAFADGALLPTKAVADLAARETIISVTQLRTRASILLNARKTQKTADGASTTINYENRSFKEAYDRLRGVGGRADDPARAEDIRTLLLTIDADWDEWILTNTSLGGNYRIEADELYFNDGGGTLTIKGVYDLNANVSGATDPYVFAHGFVENYCSAYEYDVYRAETRYESPSDCKYAAVVTPMSTTAATLKYLVGLNEPIANDSFYALTANAVYDRAQSMSNVCETARLYVLLAGLAGAFIAALLVFNCISASVADLRRELGVLRALGARGAGLLKIFLIESAIIAVVGALLGMGGAALACLLLNNVVALPLTGLKLLGFTALNALSVLGIALIAAALGAFLPAWLASRKPPVETIRAL